MTETMAVLEHPALPGMIAELVSRLHREQITYCRWPGRDDPAGAAPADCDLLVDRRDALRLSALLEQCGFRRVLAGSRFPALAGEEDYLALEEESVAIRHLRVRCRVVLRDARFRQYGVPWEARVLATRRFDARSGVYVADPAVESLVQLVQTALGERWGIGSRDGVDSAWGAGARMAELQRSFWPDPGPARHTIASSLAGFRLYRSAGAAWRRWWRALFGSPRSAGWTLPRGGVAIAFLGSDGSGKSTLLRETAAWLSPWLGTVQIYFGSGDGPSSAIRWPMLQLYRFFHRRARLAGLQPWRSGRLRRRLRAAARVVWAVTLAYEKRDKLRALTRARNRGLVVVCDRYPQRQIEGFNDGPLLAHWQNHAWWLFRALAAWESTAYAWAEAIAPDLVLKLHVQPEVAQQRKPEMQLQDLRKRTDAIRSLRFPRVTEVVEIDANEPLNDVLRHVKRCIWRIL